MENLRKIHYKWSFSIAMLVYQRVLILVFDGVAWDTEKPFPRDTGHRAVSPSNDEQ
jgi:hypothetical protein